MSALDEMTVRKLVEPFDREELIELVCMLIAQNEAVTEQLFTFCQKVKPNQNKLLILEQQLISTWMNASDMIDDFNEYGNSFGNDQFDAYGELDRMIEVLQEATFSWELRRNILNEIIELIQNDNSGFAESLIEVAEELCQTKEEKLYFANNLVKMKAAEYKKIAARLYKENGEKPQYVMNFSKSLEFASDYVELAIFYQQEGKEAEAIELAWKGLDECAYDCTKLYDFLFSYYEEKEDEVLLVKLYQFSLKENQNLDVMTEHLYHYYKKKGEIAKQKEMLIKMMLFCTSDVKTWYERCQKELSKEEHAQFEPQFIEVIKSENPLYYLDLCIERGQLEVVLSELQKQKPTYSIYNKLDEGHQYSKQLINSYPQEILTLYWQEADYYARKGQMGNYIRVVRLLEEIHKIMKKLQLENQWQVHYQNFLVDHKRKRLLMEMLQSF